MASMNKVILAGNLTRDPEGRRTNSGTSVCALGIAVNRRYRGGNGEMVEEATFVDVDVWGQSADFCRDYLRKGNSVLIEGRLKLDQWDDRNTGQKRSRLKVVAERVQSLSQRGEGGGGGGGGYSDGPAYSGGQQQQPQQNQGAPQGGGYQGGGYQQQPAPQQAPPPPPFPAENAGGQQPQAPANTGGQQPQAPADKGNAFDVEEESIDDIPF